MNFTEKKENESEMTVHSDIALHLNLDLNGMRIPKMHGARDGLKAVMSECVDALFERLGIDVEHILMKYVPRINWMNDKINSNIHEWVYKLLSFLDDELKDKIKYLPLQFRETAYFITMARIKQFVSA